MQRNKNICFITRNKKKSIKTAFEGIQIIDLSKPIKRYRLSDWMKNQYQALCCLQETNSKYKEIHIVD